MGGFAFHVAGGRATEVAIDSALGGDAPLIWVHLVSHGDEARDWLAGPAALDGYVVDALTATETRPRCEAVGEGAIVNLRGRSKVELDSSDLLGSVRIWAQAGRVFSVARNPLYAVAEVRKHVAAGQVCDPGDLITADFINGLIDVAVAIDGRLQRIEKLLAPLIEREEKRNTSPPVTEGKP